MAALEKASVAAPEKASVAAPEKASVAAHEKASAAAPGKDSAALPGYHPLASRHVQTDELATAHCLALAELHPLVVFLECCVGACGILQINLRLLVAVLLQRCKAAMVVDGAELAIQEDLHSLLEQEKAVGVAAFVGMMQPRRLAVSSSYRLRRRHGRHA